MEIRRKLGSINFSIKLLTFLKRKYFLNLKFLVYRSEIDSMEPKSLRLGCLKITFDFTRNSLLLWLLIVNPFSIDRWLLSIEKRKLGLSDIMREGARFLPELKEEREKKRQWTDFSDVPSFRSYGFPSLENIWQRCTYTADNLHSFRLTWLIDLIEGNFDLGTFIIEYDENVFVDTSRVIGNALALRDFGRIRAYISRKLYHVFEKGDKLVWRCDGEENYKGFLQKSCGTDCKITGKKITRDGVTTAHLFLGDDRTEEILHHLSEKKVVFMSNLLYLINRDSKIYVWCLGEIVGGILINLEESYLLKGSLLEGGTKMIHQALSCSVYSATVPSRQRKSLDPFIGRKKKHED